MNIIAVFGLQNAGKSGAIRAFEAFHGPAVRKIRQAGVYDLESPCGENAESLNVAVFDSSRQERGYNSDREDLGLVELAAYYESNDVDCAIIPFSLVQRGALRTDWVLRPLELLISNQHRVHVLYIRRRSLLSTTEADACFWRISELSGISTAEVIDNYEGRSPSHLAHALGRAVWNLALERALPEPVEP